MANLSGEQSTAPPLLRSEGHANRAGSSSRTSIWFCLDWILNFTFITFEPEIFQGSPPKSLKFCSHVKAGEVLPSV